MKKRFLTRSMFLKFFFVACACIMCALPARADTYYRVKLEPKLVNGATGKVTAMIYTTGNNTNYYGAGIYKVGKDGLWTTLFDQTLVQESGNPNFYIFALPGDHQSMFEGFYWDADCTEPMLKADDSGVRYTRMQLNDNSYGKTLTSYLTAEEAEQEGNIIKIYAKFIKITPSFDWATYKHEPMDGGRYYIYNPILHRFLKAPQGGDATSSNKPRTTDTPAEATVFTCDSITTAQKNTIYDDAGELENRTYKACWFTYNDGGTTRYASANSWSYWKETTSPDSRNYRINVWSWTSLGKDTFMLVDGDASASEFQYTLEMYLNGTLDYKLQGQRRRNGGIYWTFIPEASLAAQSSVTSLNENGSVTIDAPHATGTAYVKFNVSDISVPGGFTYDFAEGGTGDGHFAIIAESATCSGGVLTVPVTYEAQNVHSGSSAVSTATIKVTAKNGLSSVEGTVTAKVNLQPTFALKVSALDWNAEGETIYKGMEIAASQRSYLANKLIVDSENSSGTSTDDATTWTATITGTNASQFKFANGTQTVNGQYSATLLDVIYAPTTTGSHTATLHIETSYTDANSHNETYEKDITLSGVGSAASRITFAANGSESPAIAESYNYGEIRGTNHKDVMVELFISQITSPSIMWDASAGSFEFNPDTVDLTKKNQILSFRAHPANPVAENTNYAATLTVSGKGTSNEDVSATLMLSYTALPLKTTTATWNWATIKENTTTTTSPITTNSDATWLLTKTTGDKVTYDSEAKTATVGYLHHEPDQKATFYLTIPQTDTYTAYEDSLEMTVDASPVDICIDSKAKFTALAQYVNTNPGNSYLNYNETQDAIYLRAKGVGFDVRGCAKVSFTPQKYNTTTGVKWTIQEKLGDNSINTILNNAALTNDQLYEYSLSPGAVQLQIYNTNRAYIKNLHYWEYDTIKANYEQVVLVRSGDAISSLDVTATLANKQQVTASLNAIAAQYFVISADGKDAGSSIVFGESDGLGIGTLVNKVITVAPKGSVNVNEAQQAATGNACLLTLKDNYTYNSHEITLPIAVVSPNTISYLHSDHGSYTVTYQDDAVDHLIGAQYDKIITSADPAKFVVTLSAPSPASGYEFQGWKINGDTVSMRETFKTSIGVTCEVEALFEQIDGRYYKVGDVYFDDLAKALRRADNNTVDKVVTLTKDTTLGDGRTAITYTIPAEVTLLIPHKENFYILQTTPEIVNLANKEVLSAYRTLTLKEGVTLDCYGNICVSAKIFSANGGSKSAYTTDECGVINMANGGHIELHDGANLYCWGYIKGQDMDQGNNTQGTGTVTANSGSVVWENFELGDWRGGSASMDIYNNNVIDHRRLFPFQSYAIQNVEIPAAFKYGSTLRTFTSITTGFGNHAAVFAMVGSGNTMFKLQDAQSTVRTWYDPTTDLTCYELSGTAQLDALHVTVYIEMSSEDFILPISNSMHIILKDCDMTLSNPLMQQAGSIIEIKPSAKVNLVSELYLYDKDQWGKYVYDCYFRSFNNLTSHKDRGAENSKEGLDDAQLIVDGKLYVKDSVINAVQKIGRIYTTAGGANIMGNGGGELHFKNNLPDSVRLWAVDTIKGLPYIKWVFNRAYAANLCNEDGTYTKSYGGYTFYNVHGRWFDEEINNEKEDHTYDFSYFPTNDVSGDETWTSAVYSHDKTGLEARMKWFNVEADACENWWVGTSPAALYNYTLLNDWHQFMETETTNVYSASNNVLYRKAGCDWAEEGYIDENCLYTFVDGEENITKKALVDGHFIPLTSNGYDPAYHATANASQYYICFTGCNWHPATPYAGESKAYTINPETGVYLHYIWFNNDWLNVLRDEPFFYTEDEQTNVRTYYEYINGEWEIATPYVSVRDAAETRTFYMIKEAFNVAQIKKNATITLLRDIPNVAEVLSYETQNTTCTLDLNGHSLSGNIVNLITVNAPGATFTITDNADPKIGKIGNTANKAVYVQKGTLVVANGTIETTASTAIEGAASTTITINGGYFAATTKCVQTAGSCAISGGHFTKDANLVAYAAAHKYPFETADPKYKYEVSDAWTIVFKNGEATLQTLRLKPGETPVYTADQPTKDGYKFTGWNPAVVAATDDATYQAQFETASASESRVTLNSNGGNEGLQYVYVTTGSAIGTVPAGTTKDGYTFAGWWTTANGGIQLTAETTISADITYYAHYTKASFTLTWDANGGELSGEYTHGTVEFGAAITAPTATMAGHTCLGWNATPAATMPAHDVTYTAQWSILVKHYQQNLDGSYPASPTETEEASGEAGEYVTPAAKTYDGFITPATQTVQIGVNTEVTYQYARREYTIILDANGGECATASIEVLHGATPTLPVATKGGSNCTGWFTKAIGGDQITNETAILRNIGTLYAQYNALNVTAPLTISDTREVTDLRITTTGSLTVTGKVIADNLILEATSDVSGQLDAASEDKLDITNAFFDWKPNGETGTASRTWYAIAVPWEVNAETGIFLKETGRHLVIGQDFDLIYYDGATRASQGNKPGCWKYVQNQSDKIMHPGQLYMMYFDPGFKTIRFAKKTGSAVLYTGTVSVSEFGASDDKDANWNGIANPKTYYASLSAGTATYAQVLNNGNLDDYFADPGVVYQTINLASSKFTVGKPLFVQATEATSVVVTKQTTAGIVNAAPRRAAAELPKGIAAVYRLAIAGEDQPEADNLFVQVAEDEKADRYTIGLDLVKGGVASGRAQVWVNRYDAKLSVNTQALSENEATYPLSIQIPSNGEYTLSIGASGNEDYTLYLTRNGEAIWNLSDGAYTGAFEKGTTSEYGLRVSARAPQIATGIDEAVVDAKGETRKVMINDKVFIIRGEHIYSADGQLVK